MTKILGLDMGTKWVGVAISDSTATFARPLTTVATKQLTTFLQKTVSDEAIITIIVGHPLTMKGTQSEQTDIVEKQIEKLRVTFPHITWILWDERLSSKRAANLSNRKNDTEKQKEHARAAAFILDLYLVYRSNHLIDNSDTF